ncbi:MAG: flagellar hook-associated protein FlgL [Pseudomonadota bacterium]
MRVPNISLYKTMQLRLGDLTEQLKYLNEIVSTGKQINNLSDDPIGLTQVLDLKSSISNIVQLGKNIDVGKTWLTGGESALSNANDQILYVKNMALQLVNASSNTQQRQGAVEIIDGVLRQMLTLANTKVNGSSIFAGIETDISPFYFDDENNPTKVLYRGNENPFEIKSDSTANLPVGRNGAAVFQENYVIVDHSNNRIDFMEKNRHGETQYEIGLVNAGGTLSAADVTVTVNQHDSLQFATPNPEGRKPLQFRWDGNGNWDVFNNTDYDLPASIPGSADGLTLDLNDDGITDVTISLATPASASGDYVEIDIVPSERLLTAIIPDGKYTAEGLADIAQSAMNQASSDYGFGVTYTIDYDSETGQYTIQEDGSDSGYYDLTLLWDPRNAQGIPKVRGVNSGEGIDLGDVTISVLNSDALLHSTPYPPGTEPLRLTWNGNNAWSVSHDPGYSLPASLPGTADKIEFDLAGNSESDIAIRLANPAPGAGAYIEFDIIADIGKYSIGPDMGFTALQSFSPITGDTEFSPINNITIDHTNNRINFQEVDIYLGAGSELRATIPSGDYSDPDTLAAAMETAMETESLQYGLNVDYAVSYDAENSRFVFKADNTRLEELRLLWNSGINSGISAASILGFDHTDDISGSMGGDLTANGWDAGDTITITFAGGENTSTFTHTILGGDTTADLLNLMEAQLTADLGTNGGFAVNGNNIDFTMNNSGLSITAITDDNGSGSGNSATINVSGNTGTVVRPDGATSLTVGDTVRFFAPHDDIITFPSSDSYLRPIAIDSTNNTIDFLEDSGGGLTGPLQAVIPSGNYTEQELAAAVETAMETVSAGSGNAVNYAVSYNGSRYTIQEDAGAPVLNELYLLWNSGPNASKSAANTLGFDSSGNTTGSIGGDLTALDWDTGDTIGITFSTAGHSLNYSHTVAAGDTSDSILSDLRDQLSHAFAQEGTFTLNGSRIEFTIQNTALQVNGITDDNGSGTGNNVRIEVSGIGGSTLMPAPGPTITIGDTVTFYAQDDDVAPVTTSFSSDNDVVLVSIDDTNNAIDFEEFNSSGISRGRLHAAIPNGNYTDLSTLAAAVETALETESEASGHGIDYRVIYDAGNRRFRIQENGTELNQLSLLWNTGDNAQTSAAEVLGFSPLADGGMIFPGSDSEVIRITIDETNNRIDFKELINGVSAEDADELTAIIPSGDYTDTTALASAIETAMESESTVSGHGIDYDVSYDPAAGRFTIKESGVILDELQVLWNSGTHASINAADTLGFAAEDDAASPIKSGQEVEWGIFKTLIDLKNYLLSDDIDGITRSISRLDTDFEHIKSVIADTGIKYNRLTIKESIMSDINLSLTERRTNLEEADIIKAIMDLRSQEFAYEAALQSSAKILQLSLMDYL